MKDFSMNVVFTAEDLEGMVRERFDEGESRKDIKINLCDDILRCLDDELHLRLPGIYFMVDEYINKLERGEA